MIMPVTHGIVGRGQSILTDFRLETTTSSLLDPVDFDVYAPLGSTVFVDYGDGLIDATIIDVSPKTVLGSSSGLNQVITGEFIERLSFRVTSNIRTINLVNGASINSLVALTTNNSTVETVSIALVPNALSMESVCLQASSLVSFFIDDSSKITNMKNAFVGTNLPAAPALDYSSVLDAQAMYQNSSISSTGIINSDVCLNFLAMFAGCSLLDCIAAINTLSQTNTSSMFLNTPLLVAPNATEQAAILAGSNYINAGACP